MSKVKASAASRFASERICQTWMESGLTTEDVADRSGIPANRVVQIMSGSHESIGIGELHKLAHVFAPADTALDDDGNSAVYRTMMHWIEGWDAE